MAINRVFNRDKSEKSHPHRVAKISLLIAISNRNRGKTHKGEDASASASRR